MGTQQQSGIVQVTPYYRSVRGGIATMENILVRQLEKHAQLAVIITGEKVSESNNNSDKVTVSYQELRLPFGGSNVIKSILGWIYYLIPTLIALLAVNRVSQAGIMHLHYASPDDHYFRILHNLTGCPYVITVHGSDIMRNHERQWVARILTRYTLKGACHVVAVSNALAKNAVECFPFLRDKITVIHNGVDTGAIQKAISQSHKVADIHPRPYFICVGGLQKVKGHDVAIDTWALLKNQIQDLDLIIIGVGDLHNKYVTLINTLGMQQRITLAGGFPSDQVWRMMSGAVGMILPSRNEGLPYVILEAGVVGIPVIATRVGGIPELVQDGKDGLLVSPENPQELASAVMRIYTDRELANTLARSLSAKVVKSFTAEAMAERYVSVYRQCGWQADSK